MRRNSSPSNTPKTARDGKAAAARHSSELSLDVPGKVKGDGMVRLEHEPFWTTAEVRGGYHHTLTCAAAVHGDANRRAALARFEFFDAKGHAVAPDMSISRQVGSFMYIGDRVERGRLELRFKAPRQARHLRLGLQRWQKEAVDVAVSPAMHLRLAEPDLDSFDVAASTVALNHVPVPNAVRMVRDHAFDRYGRRKINAAFRDSDWRRISYVLSRLDGGEALLDVGVGRGFFTNAAARSARYRRVVGTDIKAYEIFERMSSSLEIVTADVANMPFKDNEFDTVVCMEVLEHLEDDHFAAGLQELRRVCRRQLIVSVPFNEPLPLPEYHKGRFTPERLNDLFPDAKKTLLMKHPVSPVPWILIEETQRPGCARSP